VAGLSSTRHTPAQESQEGWSTLRRNIFAFVCPHCGDDRVWETLTDQHWDLDPDNYGDGGSTERMETLF